MRSTQEISTVDFAKNISEIGFPDLLTRNGGIDILKYVDRIYQILGHRSDLTIEDHELKYKDGLIFPFLRISSNGINHESKVVVARAGVHANEISGIFFWLKYGKEIFDYAHSKGIKLIVYPAANPSGLKHVIKFPQHIYNHLNDVGSDRTGNCDYHCYLLDDGRIIDDLGAVGKEVKVVKWLWADEVSGLRLAGENKKMLELMKKIDLKFGPSIVKAVLDIHQEVAIPRKDFGTNNGAAAFGYLQDQSSHFYRKIVEEINEVVPILRNCGNLATEYFDGGIERTDGLGFIYRKDGNWPDAWTNLGVKYSVTTETSCFTPLDLAMGVAGIWMKGLIDIAANE